MVRQPAGWWLDGRVGAARFSGWTKGGFHRHGRCSDSGCVDGCGVRNLGRSDQASGAGSPHPRVLVAGWIQGLFHARHNARASMSTASLRLAARNDWYLDNAYFPEPLPDGSLLVTRSKGEPAAVVSLLAGRQPDGGAAAGFLERVTDSILPFRSAPLPMGKRRCSSAGR